MMRREPLGVRTGSVSHNGRDALGVRTGSVSHDGERAFGSEDSECES